MEVILSCAEGLLLLEYEKLYPHGKLNIYGKNQPMCRAQC